MKPPPLTRRQREILDFLERYIGKHNISPTLEEIAQDLGVNKVTIFGHVAELERKGMLVRAAKGISRGLQVVQSSRPESARVSILGRIAAGRPIEAVENPEDLDLQDWLPPGREVYALRVRGESMINDSICDGDLVVVERRTEAQDGETVVAVLSGDETTLKRFYREGTQIRLQPANATMQPILADDDQVEIRGVVIAVLRRF